MQGKTRAIALKLGLAALVIGLGFLIRERVSATHETQWIVAGWILSGLLALRLAAAVLRGWRRHAANGVSLASIDAMTMASTPGWAQGYYSMEKRAYRYTWRAITGAALAPAGQFAVSQGALGGKRTLSLIMTVALCGAAIAWCLPRYFAPLWPLLGAYAALAVAALYALVWIVGERRSLREGGHAIDGRVLQLDVGLRASASVALDAIASCVAIGGRARRDHAWQFTPGEKNNVSLEVRQPFAAVIRGTPRQLAAGRVLLYVDDPISFVAAVNRAMAASRLSA